MKTQFFLFQLLLQVASVSTELVSQTTEIADLGCIPAAPAPDPVPASDEDLVKNAITRFMHGGDASDTTLLGTVLNDQFRVVVNQGVLGSETLRTVDKTTYFSMISAKKWGGVPRSVDIVSVTVAGTIATAVVKTSSVRSDITSFLHLVKDKAGQWTIVNDTAFPVPKKVK